MNCSPRWSRFPKPRWSAPRPTKTPAGRTARACRNMTTCSPAMWFLTMHALKNTCSTSWRNAAASTSSRRRLGMTTASGRGAAKEASSRNTPTTKSGDFAPRCPKIGRTCSPAGCDSPSNQAMMKYWCRPFRSPSASGASCSTSASATCPAFGEPYIRLPLAELQHQLMMSGLQPRVDRRHRNRP